MRENAGVDAATLERLEPLVPETVAQIRSREGRPDGDAAQSLHRALEAAVADGELSMRVDSTYGETYEVLNLPTSLREVELSVPGGRYHIDNVEGQVRRWLADEDTSLRELSYAIEALVDHREAIEGTISEHENEFEERRRTIERDIESVRAIASQLEGTVGERARKLVLENRHEAFDGVTEVRDGVADARRALHECSFETATSRLRELESAVDGLLTAVDFLRSLVGGIEHGQSTITLPDGPTRALYQELEELLEEQYDVELALEDDRILVTRPDSVEDATGTDHGSVAEPGDEPTADEPETAADPAAVTDEILYVLRELTGADTSGGTVEYQTEQLPAAIGRQEVLEALARFCRRQSPVVASVTVQDGAPPGFFHIEFTEGTEPEAGLDSLTDTFVERYGTHN